MTKFILPQDDGSAARMAEIDAAKVANTLTFDQGVPLGTPPSRSEAADIDYAILLYKAIFRRRANLRGVAEKSGLKFAHGLAQMDTADIMKMLLTGKLTEANAFFTADMGPILPNSRPTSLADYDKLYQRDAVPASKQNVHSDTALANMFLGGAQPDILKRMTAVPAKFPLTDGHLQAVPALAGDTLAQAISQGRIYYVDYAALSGIHGGVHPQQMPKYLYAPLLAFAVPATGGTMVPFAIQLGQTPDGREIYTPLDGWSWRIASTMVQAAANAYSATVSHLAETHLVLEPIAVCTARNLSQKHPLFALLHPHFINTRAINAGAFKVLVGKDQTVDRMVGGDMPTTFALVADRLTSFDFSGQYIPKRFAANQTSDAKILANYAFRDDSLLIWEALSTWVGDYLSFYYRNDAAVLADREVQAWAREIGSPTWGKVKNFASGDGVASLRELIDTVTMIIFTAGPQHAVVNFAQRTDMAYVPAAPLAGYIPEIRGKGHTEQDWLNTLPPLDVGLVQATLSLVLGDLYYSSLGGYKVGAFDAEIGTALQRHQAKLATIEATILARNRTRTPFIHLLPSKIPQSVNI